MPTEAGWRLVDGGQTTCTWRFLSVLFCNDTPAYNGWDSMNFFCRITKTSCA